MRIFAIAAFAAASAFAFSAMAADQTSTSGQQPKTQTTSTTGTTAKPADLDRVICHSAEADTGSHLPGKRTCHTKREWDEIANQARQDFEQNMAHSTGTTSH